MVKHLKLFLLFLCFCQSVSIQASVQETLPSWHWSIPIIEELKLQTNLNTLTFLNQPFRRGEIAKVLIEIKKDESLSLSQQAIDLIALLEKEFKPEMDQILNADKPNEIALGLNVAENVGNFESDTDVKGIYRSRVNVALGNHLAAHNSVVINQFLVDDTLYIGKQWRGMVAYNEQAYVTWQASSFLIKFGRDWLQWGAGRHGTLFFSDVARPMDQLLIKGNLANLTYTFLFSQLDDIRTGDDSLSAVYKRYISAHRLNASFFEGKLQCAVTEALLYSGENRSVDLNYLNPFLIYYGAQINRKDKANMFLCMDLLYQPTIHTELYASLLIDDIQVEKTGPGDLEPNEIGWIAGGRYANPFNVEGLVLGLEYSRVSNRTYKTPSPWETVIHRNQPLGHPLGNDFDFLCMDLSQWIGLNLNVGMHVSMIRKGEGSIYTEWDAPWMNYTVEQGYSEPFPAGVVETRKEFGLSAKYYPSTHWGLEGEMNLINRDNADHMEGVSKSDNTWKIGFWWQGDIRVKSL